MLFRFVFYSSRMLCPICKSLQTRPFACKDNFPFYRCKPCKTIFLKNVPSALFLNSYYSKTFLYSDGDINEPIIRKRDPLILARLKSIAPSAKTLCDVGSGFGYFLDDAQTRGYTVCGIEPSKKLARDSRRNYKLLVYEGSLDEYIKDSKDTFDIVTCIHVIEHVRNPKDFIKKLTSLVKPGGILYIETPNSDSHLLYVEKERYTFLIPPDHLWLFSHFSINSLLPANSSLIKTSTYSYSEHFMGIIKTIIRSMSLRAKPSTAKQSVFHEPATPRNSKSLRKLLFYYLFDCILAPLFTPLLNLYHKGSILELYIKKKSGKSGL